MDEAKYTLEIQKKNKKEVQVYYNQMGFCGGYATHQATGDSNSPDNAIYDNDNDLVAGID